MSIKLERKRERKTQIMPPTGAKHENQIQMSFGHVALTTVVRSCRELNHLPQNGRRLCCFCLLRFFQRFPRASVLWAPGGASSRGDSSMKSIWDFQWTLERAALISRGHTSRAVTCQSPSGQHPGPAPRSSSPALVSGDPVPVAEWPGIPPARWHPVPVGRTFPQSPSDLG